MFLLFVYTVATLLICWILLGEFSYFGSGWTKRLYNWQAATYECKWSGPVYGDAELNRQIFVEPVLAIQRRHHEIRVLDLACGTGRFTRLLQQSKEVRGSIDAVDQSENMLAVMKNHLEATCLTDQVRVNIIQAEASEYCSGLDARTRYHVIAVLEASEFIPDFNHVLRHCCNHIQPGGLLLFTVVRPWIARLLPFRVQRIGQLTVAMQRAGVDLIEVKRWHPRYDVVVARKPVVCEQAERRAEIQQSAKQECSVVF